MNEAEARLLRIDPALKATGRGVVEGSRIRPRVPHTPGRLEGHGKRGKALSAGHVLECRNTKLAVRFHYATNGQGVYGIDTDAFFGRRERLLRANRF